MEIYRNFGIEDSQENIAKALNSFIQMFPNKWHLMQPSKELGDKYIVYKYRKSHKLTLKIFLLKTEYGLKIANILPDERNSISKKEYNEAVMDFYNDLKKAHPQYQNSVTTNIFDPLQIMSQNALTKLRDFYLCANKSTGSSHPDDEQRWFAFICQTVEDKKIITAEQEFLEFLQDKEYWGIDVFEEDVAFELLHEYNKITGCLKYYINITRG